MNEIKYFVTCIKELLQKYLAIWCKMVLNASIIVHKVTYTILLLKSIKTMGLNFVYLTDCPQYTSIYFCKLNKTFFLKQNIDTLWTICSCSSRFAITVFFQYLSAYNKHVFIIAYNISYIMNVKKCLEWAEIRWQQIDRGNYRATILRYQWKDVTLCCGHLASGFRSLVFALSIRHYRIFVFIQGYYFIYQTAY